MAQVKAKKHLGQHFLNNEIIAEKIANSLSIQSATNILEIGPGMGVLTKYFLDIPDFYTCEIDTESITYLQKHYPQLTDRILNEDFLKINIDNFFSNPVSIIGNFPYNISSQILFKVLDFKDKIPELVGMFQKEVAERVCSKPGSKQYGIISVLLQAYYNCEYLFTVGEQEFTPPPKVKSGVIKLQRNSVSKLDCNETLFKQVIKTGFNQRRKTLRNSLKQLFTTDKELDILKLRPEQLSVEDFIHLTNLISEHQKGGQ